MDIIIDLLKQSANNYPKKAALQRRLKYRTNFWTYSDLLRFASGIAALLEEKGIKRGDRVILWSENSPYWVGSFFGCFLRGAVVVPLYTENLPEFIKNVAQLTQAKAILKSSLMPDIDLDILKIIIDYQDDLLKNDHHFLEPHIAPQDIAEIIYTSGTTGEPKGVILTHQNIVSNVKTLLKTIPIQESDRVLSILPLSHMFEQVVGMLAPLAIGAKVIYSPSLSSIVIRSHLKEHKITKMAAVPEFLRLSMMRLEAKVKKEGKERIFHNLQKISLHLPFFLRRIIFKEVTSAMGGKLKFIASGGAPLDVNIAKKWEALGVEILEGYGLTETSPVVSCNTFSQKKPGSVGKPIEGVRVKIAESGEILIKGPNIFSGYWKDSQKTEEVFTSDGWFKTGDMGYMDKKGFLYIRGRKKYMIVTEAGQNVYPEDIEFELNQEKEVKDSCVIDWNKDGRPRIHAVILGEIRDAKNLIEKVNQKLAPYQQIQSFSIWPPEDFPRTVTRKVKRDKVLAYLKEQAVPSGASQKIKEFSPLQTIISQITGVSVSEVSSGSMMQELNLDSLMRIELLAAIEEKFGVILDESLITPKTKLEDIERIIKQQKPYQVKWKLVNWPRYPLVSFLRNIAILFIFFPLMRIFVNLEVRGKENLSDLSSPAIFMANHISDFDTPVIFRVLPSYFRRHLAVATAADVLFEQFKYVQPIVTFLFNAYPFPRKTYTRLGPEYTGRLIDGGWSILLFPEGEISEDARLLPFKEGVGLIAAEMRVPVVPIEIQGTEKIVAPHTHFPRSMGKVIVQIQKPIYFKKGTSYFEAKDKIEKYFSDLN